MTDTENTTKSNPEVANTILKQLGGAKVGAMLGVPTFVYDSDSLSFNFKARAKRSINHVTIRLNARDLYDVKLSRVRNYGLDWKVISEHTDVHAENLRELIERETGCYLSL